MADTQGGNVFSGNDDLIPRAVVEGGQTKRAVGVALQQIPRFIAQVACVPEAVLEKEPLRRQVLDDLIAGSTTDLSTLLVALRFFEFGSESSNLIGQSGEYRIL
jgi:hypothetical protein